MNLQSNGVSFVLVSHKTKTPYKGKQYDLHAAAINWLSKNLFFDKNFLDWTTDQIFFEPTKENKIQRIIDEKCDIFIDDLLEILNMLPLNIKGILYDPPAIQNSFHHLKFDDWNRLQEVLDNVSI